MITHRGVLDVVQELIGPEITSNPIQHVRLKPPATTLGGDEARAHIMATDWHQDRAVAHAEGDATQMVTVWLAVTDATLENGCLQVIPGRPQSGSGRRTTAAGHGGGRCDLSPADATCVARQPVECVPLVV